MNPQRISLSHPTLHSRIKKYDRYDPYKSPARNQTKASIVDLPVPEPETAFRKAHTLASKSQQKSINRTQTIALNSVRDSGHFRDNQLQTQFNDEQEVTYVSSKRKPSRLHKAMYFAGLVIFLFAMSASVFTFMTNQQSKEQAATLGVRTDDQGVVQGTGDNPSEEPVSNDALLAYKPVNPAYPRYIRIPSVNLMSRVKVLGVDNDGAVDAPSNIYDAGWYNGSVLPGNPSGVSLIVGHVSSWTSDGVFKNLDKLIAGQKIEIERGSGDKVVYEVSRVESKPVSEINMQQVLNSESTETNELRLMTCDGAYNKDTQTFESRLIVYAKRIQ